MGRWIWATPLLAPLNIPPKKKFASFLGMYGRFWGIYFSGKHTDQTITGHSFFFFFTALYMQFYSIAVHCSHDFFALFFQSNDSRSRTFGAATKLCFGCICEHNVEVLYGGDFFLLFCVKAFVRPRE